MRFFSRPLQEIKILHPFVNSAFALNRRKSCWKEQILKTKPNNIASHAMSQKPCMATVYAALNKCFDSGRYIFLFAGTRLFIYTFSSKEWMAINIIPFSKQNTHGIVECIDGRV